MMHKILFGLFASLFATVIQAGNVPSDLGGETGKRMVQVAARAQDGFWEMRGVYGSSGTLNLWLAWNGKGCVGKGSLWAFHRPAPKASALASLALSGVTEADIVEIYARAYPPNFRQVFMDEIKMKVGAKWFTGAQLIAIDSSIASCD
jgi:hypothetical protein